ncbi:ubiquinone biosynthesis monooxygenase Coq7 [Parvibaculum indicum]|uniref:demethoxyubiquinone hydroxylase family protein n=1 Tax=Parvibaculum indicum TaxID=562969 RepID=UPI001FE4C4AC|nr:demethoxyubiquinone hydroxylase family protein [Parvibaculum indicum]NIJ42407.1 ubiquinone biosynthesis monooxygenase Coq7 [Parvibaculum indicum]
MARTSEMAAKRDMAAKRPGVKRARRKSPSGYAKMTELPGVTRQDAVQEMVRVDHAGEYGAVRIYSGQLAVFERLPHKRKITESLAHMRDEEEVHLAKFSELIRERGVRPTALTPFWHVAGFALGAATALMGEKAAHACTAAVEEVIDGHYRDQIAKLKELGGEEAELADTIETFREEEVRHKEEALAEGAEEAVGYPLLSGAIRLGCKLAIRVAEKV